MLKTAAKASITSMNAHQTCDFQAFVIFFFFYVPIWLQLYVVDFKKVEVAPKKKNKRKILKIN